MLFSIKHTFGRFEHIKGIKTTILALMKTLPTENNITMGLPLLLSHLNLTHTTLGGN